MKKYGVADYIECSIFFEGIGVFLKKKIVDVNLVDELFSVSLKFMYERLKPIIDSNRQRFNDPRVFEHFEYLYDEMKKREQNLQTKNT